jgi:hypothetical protein
LLNVRGDIAATGAAARCVDLRLNGKSNSFLELTISDHVFGMAT